MSDEKPVLGNEESDRDDAETVNVTEQAPDRRRLFRRLVTLAGLGITGVLLSQEKIGLLPRAEAGGTSGTALIIDAEGSSANTGIAKTEIASTVTGDSAFLAHASATTGATYGLSRTQIRLTEQASRGSMAQPQGQG